MSPRGAALALALALAAGCTQGVEPRPPAPTAAEPALPVALAFEDATAASGIRFVHETGAFGEKRLPETMGAGAVFFDYDADGALDLFLVNGTGFQDAPGERRVGRCALYRGRGDGTFEDVSRAARADVEVYGMGAAAADYDADGDVDLYVTALGDDLLLRNDRGVFTDVAEEAGVGRGRWKDGEGNEHAEWTTACLWLDADADGDLDLFVAGYCEWTPELEIFTTLDGVEKAFTTPDRYRGLPCRLYANRGDGKFEEVEFEAPAPRSIGKALGVAVWDFDANGLPDLVVANDTRPNFLFEGLGGGSFREVAALARVAYDENGRARAGMGIDVAELDAGAPVVAIGNFAGEPVSLYGRGPSGVFEQTASAAGIALSTVAPLAFGLTFQDLDLDGHLDLVVANGHIEPDIARMRAGERHAQAPQLFLGRGGGELADVSHDVGADFQKPLVGRGLVTGDVDRDGDLDLLLTQNGGSPVLLLNRVRELAGRHFLRVDLAQDGANPRALGARVSARTRLGAAVRMVRTGSSYLGHGETTLTFGLGADAGPVRLEIRWPDGALQEVAVAAVDRIVEVEREPAR